MTEWFYEKSGQRLGPVLADNMLAHRETGEITDNTLVWTKAFGSEWRRFADAGLNPGGSSPPPLPTPRIDSSFAWLYALVPIIGMIAERIARELAPQISFDLTFVAICYAAVYGVLAYFDVQQIERSGRKKKAVNVGWFFWLAPAYLFARARVLGDNQMLLLIWIGAFAVVAVLSARGIM